MKTIFSRCNQCDNIIFTSNPIYRAYDCNLCSKSCLFKRTNLVEQIDPQMSYPSLWHNINNLSNNKSLSLKKKTYSFFNLQEQENKQQLPSHDKQQYIDKIPKLGVKEPLEFKKSYFHLLKYLICYFNNSIFNLKIFKFYQNHRESVLYHLHQDMTQLELL
uniref:Uncharacterized protein n=1 Tax=viral metagenome TaxID=1070528 RepID=A0A6C0AWP8_9ZZZZ